MPRIKFTRHLVRFFPDLAQTGIIEIEGDSVSEIVTNLDAAYPGLAAYLVDEHGRLRKHVNIFVGEELIVDRQKLSDTVMAGQQIYIYQALSGG